MFRALLNSTILFRLVTTFHEQEINMSLSDASDDDTSSDEVEIPAKRVRTNTFGASSTTSQGSGSQDSDGDQTDPQASKKTNYNEDPKENLRLSSTSYENGSSPTQASDDYRPEFNSINDLDNGEDNERASFQNSGDANFYNKGSTTSEEDPMYQKYSKTSKLLMRKMGYQFGKGLGKLGDGRVAPIKASTQKGKRGLGIPASAVSELPEDLKWTPDEPQGSAKEVVKWMPTPPETLLSADDLDDWLQRGPKKLTIDDETEFVDPQVLESVLSAKTIFDTLHDEDLRQARFRSNPYETIGSAIFLNRAAVKMANMDAVFDFMFTNPKTPDGSSVLKNEEILYFADVCAGPGGFSEYVLYRKKWKAKGFGFTLKGACDFKLSEFHAGTPETFNTYYGVKDDGNIFDPDNLDSLKEYVLKQTDDLGVHFLMADGGFSVEGKENIQEILSKQLYLCQCIAALMLVRTGGHFVVKLFDIFTPFSVGLLYIMYRCFEKVCIHKPVTSRPANSERYLICKWKKLGTDSVERHMLRVNAILAKDLDPDEDITELVPLSVIKEDRGFYEYIYRSNNELGEIQIKNLHKIAAYSKDETLYETSQSEMRRECLQLWNIPDEMRKRSQRLKPDDTLLQIISMLKEPPRGASTAQVFKDNVLNKEPNYLEKPEQIDSILSNVYDWYYVYSSESKKNTNLKIFIGCGGKQVYKLERNGSWAHVVELTMPEKTLVYGEITTEFFGQGLKQRRNNRALHIIDALMLGGEDISYLPITERIVQCSMLCNALEKPPQECGYQIRCKKLFAMEYFADDIQNLEYRNMKTGGTAITFKTPERNNPGNFYKIGSVILIKEMKAPWLSHRSKKINKKYYYYRTKNGRDESTYTFPEGGALDTLSAYIARVMWPWDPYANEVYQGKNRPGVVTAAKMIEFINKNKLR